MSEVFPDNTVDQVKESIKRCLKFLEAYPETSGTLYIKTQLQMQYDLLTNPIEAELEHEKRWLEDWKKRNRPGS